MTDTTPPINPSTDKPWTYNLDVRVTPPAVTTTTEVLQVACSNTSVYVVRRNYPDNTWTVTADRTGRETLVPNHSDPTTAMTYDQAVEWATRRVEHVATRNLARTAAVAAAAHEWPDPAAKTDDGMF